MSVTTVRGSLVGMKYYSVSIEEAAKHLARKPTLKREAHNVHDSNAVAVMAGQKMFGHIDRETAGIIAPLLDDGAVMQVDIDPRRPRSIGSIPIVIKIERSLESIQAPAVCEPGVVGIYQISVKGYDRCYIGQSVNVQHRLEEHWDELKRGIHQNSELRRAWRTEGGHSFQAVLLERAPEALCELGQARWLVEHERAWVEQCGGLGNTINAVEPRIVLNERTRAELDRERRTNAGKLASLEDRSESLSETIYRQRNHADELRQSMKEISGFWGLFASSEARRKAELAAKKLPALQENISKLEEELRKTDDTFYALKRQLFLPL